MLDGRLRHAAAQQEWWPTRQRAKADGPTRSEYVMDTSVANPLAPPDGTYRAYRAGVAPFMKNQPQNAVEDVKALDSRSRAIRRSSRTNISVLWGVYEWGGLRPRGKAEASNDRAGLGAGGMPGCRINCGVSL